MSALLSDAALDLMRDLVYDAVTHGAVGTSDAALGGAQTALDAEVFRDSLAAKTKQSKALVLKLVLGSQQANGQTLLEIGVFDALSGGVMHARGLPTEVEKTSSVSVLYTVTISWSSGA